MSIEVGAIITGKVTGIQPFGAFVALDDNVQGMVHISEVSNRYVKDINDYLKVGEEVTVKVLDIKEDGRKITLSIKATQPAEEKPVRKETQSRQPQQSRPRRKVRKQTLKSTESEGYNTLEQKLKEALKK